MIDLLNSLYVTCGTWEKTKKLIERFGGPVFNKSVWWQIATGARKPTRQQQNAVLALFPGWPLVAPSAIDAAQEHNVTRVIVAAADPDIAVFLNTNGLPIEKITARTGNGIQLESIQTHVSNANKRRRPSRVSLCYPDLGAPRSRETKRGQSGNLEAIKERLGEAVVAAATVAEMSAASALSELHI